MPTIQELAKRLKTGVKTEAEALDIKARIVNVEQDGVTTWRVVGEINKVWVRLHGGEVNDIQEAYNDRVKGIDGLPVWVKLRDGEFTVTGTRAKDSTDLLGEYAGQFATPDKVGELSATTWPGRNLLPGRVAVLSAAEPLTIRVEAHMYEWHGQIKLWPGGTLDMTDYLPVTSTYWCWAWVVIDPSTDTLFAVTGEEVAGIALLTDTKLAEIGATLSGLHPLEALRLQEGMTALDRLEYFFDARVWLGNSQLPTVPSAVTTPYEIVPVGRKMHWPAPLEITTGTLTIEGTVIVS